MKHTTTLKHVSERIQMQKKQDNWGKENEESKQGNTVKRKQPTPMTMKPCIK